MKGGGGDQFQTKAQLECTCTCAADKLVQCEWAGAGREGGGGVLVVFDLRKSDFGGQLRDVVCSKCEGYTA